MLKHLIRRHKDAIADVFAFLPGFVAALAVLAVARLGGDRSQTGFFIGSWLAIMLPILCGFASLVLLRGRTKSFDIAGMLDRLDDVQLYVWLALAGLALVSLLYLLFFVLIAVIIF